MVSSDVKWSLSRANSSAIVPCKKRLDSLMNSCFEGFDSFAMLWILLLKEAAFDHLFRAVEERLPVDFRFAMF
jgi:hypothetical protein